MESNKSEQKISFKPLTEGLGFHPFEEGLPYAPAPQKKSQAAPPSPAPSIKQSQTTVSFQLEKALKTAEKSDFLSNAALNALKNAEASSTQVSTQKPSAVPNRKKQIHSQRTLSYSLRRVFAYALDTSLFTLLAGGLLFFTFPNQDFETLFSLDTQDLILAALFYLGCHWALMTAEEVAFGTTLGKLAFNLKLPGSGFDALLRAILFLPSLGLLGLGILLGAFDSQKRCWHDRATGIQPIGLQEDE